MTDLSLWATEEARKIIAEVCRQEDIRDADDDGAYSFDIRDLEHLIATALTSAILKGQEERWRPMSEQRPEKFIGLRETFNGKLAVTGAGRISNGTSWDGDEPDVFYVAWQPLPAPPSILGET